MKIKELMSEQSNNVCHRIAPEQISNHCYSKNLILCSKQALREMQNMKQSTLRASSTPDVIVLLWAQN